jgi:hypothetical protein
VQRELIPAPDGRPPNIAVVQAAAPPTPPVPEPTDDSSLYHLLHEGAYQLPTDGANMRAPAVSERVWAILQQWMRRLDKKQMYHCERCKELWFDVKLVQVVCPPWRRCCRGTHGVCDRCIAKDRDVLESPDEESLYLYSHANLMDPGDIPSSLPALTDIEQLMIAPIHVSMHVAHIKGAQYRYKGHVMTFLRDVPDIVTRLPRLPANCNIVLIKPQQTLDDPRRGETTQQFRRSFTVRRREVLVSAFLALARGCTKSLNC